MAGTLIDEAYGGIDEPFPGGSHGADSIVPAVFLPEHIGGLVGVLAPQITSIAQCNLIVVNHEIHRSFGLAFNYHCVVTGELHVDPEVTSRGARGDGAREGP